MPQDAFTLRFLSQELNSLLQNGKINKIIQPNEDIVVLTVFNSKKTVRFYLDVNPSMPRVGITERDFETPITAPNFCMLLRKHLLDATIFNISLIDFDRIIRIDCLSSNEFFDSVEKHIYVELMGRYSNIILCEGEKVLGCNRGINSFDNGVRPLICGKKYVFPPMGEKKSPQDKSLIEDFGNYNGDDFAKFLTQKVSGIAYSTAQEMENEIKIGVNNPQTAFEIMNNFVYEKKSSPCIYYDDYGVKDVCAFHYNNIKDKYIDYEFLYQAEEEYFAKKEGQKKFLSLKERLSNLTSTAKKKAQKKLTLLLQKQNDANNLEEDKIKGELILSNIYKIKGGEESVELDNYYDSSKMTVLLDKNKSPQQNAQDYYKRYTKKKRTLSSLQPQIDQAKIMVDYYGGLENEINLCENYEELELIFLEAQENGLIKKQQTKKKNEKKQFRVFNVDGFIVKCGRNNVENDQLISQSRGENIWLHLKDGHSSHIIIETNGKNPSMEIIRNCAEICAYYSKDREGGKTEVVFTLKKNIKKPNGAPLGFVIYEDYQSLMVKPIKHQEQRIME